MQARSSRWILSSFSFTTCCWLFLAEFCLWLSSHVIVWHMSQGRQCFCNSSRQRTLWTSRHCRSSYSLSLDPSFVGIPSLYFAGFWCNMQNLLNMNKTENLERGAVGAPPAYGRSQICIPPDGRSQRRMWSEQRLTSVALDSSYILLHSRVYSTFQSPLPEDLTLNPLIQTHSDGYKGMCNKLS